MSEENQNPTPAGTPDPAPTPAPAPAPAPSPSPATPEAPAAQEQPYVPDTGSKQLDVALGFFVKSLGLSPESPEIQELRRTGNVEYLKGAAAQKGMDSALLEPYLALASGGLGELEASSKERDEKLRAEIAGYAGGEEKMKSTLDFVKANSTPEQLEEFDELLQRGGVAAQALMQFFQSRMSADPNTTVQGRDAVAPNAAAAPTSTTGYADRAAWRAAQHQLMQRHGAGYANTPEGQAWAAAFPG